MARGCGGWVALGHLVSCYRPDFSLTSQISDEAMQANKASNVSNRGVTGEPMYMLFNLGMSESE